MTPNDVDGVDDRIEYRLNAIIDEALKTNLKQGFKSAIAFIRKESARIQKEELEKLNETE
jgi:hypothetical protein